MRKHGICFLHLIVYDSATFHSGRHDVSEASFEALVEVAPQSQLNGLFDVDLKTLSSAALARLVEEVRHDDPLVGKAYDRTHNRHNR
jgi:hypothetical protein